MCNHSGPVVELAKHRTTWATSIRSLFQHGDIATHVACRLCRTYSPGSSQHTQGNGVPRDAEVHSFENQAVIVIGYVINTGIGLLRFMGCGNERAAHPTRLGRSTLTTGAMRRNIAVRPACVTASPKRWAHAASKWSMCLLKHMGRCLNTWHRCSIESREKTAHPRCWHDC